MLKIEIEKRLTTIIAWGALTITLLITDKLSSDPVNLGKMVVLSFTAGRIITVLFKNRKLLIGSLQVTFLIVIGFLVICLSSIIFIFLAMEIQFCYKKMDLIEDQRPDASRACFTYM